MCDVAKAAAVLFSIKMKISSGRYDIRNKNKVFHPLTEGVYFCPVCNRYGRFMDMVGKPRFAVKCPYCRSLERHRFLFFIYKKYFLNTRKPIHVLHTAPEKCICDLIGRYPLVDYVPMDLSPERYRFCRCRKEDVTNLSFADNTFDVVLSNQVMEHIMDESKFLTELLRVLKPGGLFLLNFPVYMGLEKLFRTIQSRHRKSGKNTMGNMTMSGLTEGIFSAG